MTYREALRQLVLDLKYTEATRDYSYQTMWKYLLEVCGGSERLLTRIRIDLRAAHAVLPNLEGRKLEKWVLRYYPGVVEELTYLCRGMEAEKLWRSETAMYGYLLSVYGKKDLHEAIIRARRSKATKPWIKDCGYSF